MASGRAPLLRGTGTVFRMSLSAWLRGLASTSTSPVTLAVAVAVVVSVSACAM